MNSRSIVLVNIRIVIPMHRHAVQAYSGQDTVPSWGHVLRKAFVACAW